MYILKNHVDLGISSFHSKLVVAVDDTCSNFHIFLIQKGFLTLGGK